jgi:hypothetical protein
MFPSLTASLLSSSSFLFSVFLLWLLSSEFFSVQSETQRFVSQFKLILVNKLIFQLKSDGEI